jgi:hypothetical protein
MARAEAERTLHRVAALGNAVVSSKTTKTAASKPLMKPLYCLRHPTMVLVSRPSRMELPAVLCLSLSPNLPPDFLPWRVCASGIAHLG